jgi:hypothetical protein
MQRVEKASSCFLTGDNISRACVTTVLARSLSLSLSHVSSCATTMMMLTVWQSMCVYYLLLLSATATATTIFIDGSNRVLDGSVRAYVLFPAWNGWRTRAICSFLQYVILTRQWRHAYTHTQWKRFANLCCTGNNTIHTHKHAHKRASKIKNPNIQLFSSSFFCLLFVLVSIFILLDLFYCMIGIRRIKNDHQEDNNNEQQTWSLMQ